MQINMGKPVSFALQLLDFEPEVEKKKTTKTKPKNKKELHTVLNHLYKR